MTDNKPVIRLKQTYKIYFVNVWFDQTVYIFGGGGGFTNYHCFFVLAQSEHDAEESALAKFNKDNISVRKLNARLSLNQNIDQYCFIDSMFGFNEACDIAA